MLAQEHVFCTDCLSSLPKTNYHLDPDNPVKTRLAGRLPLEHAFAFLHFRKSGIVQTLLHQLKYKNQPEIGVAIGLLYGRELAAAGLGQQFNLIVPVPLHRARHRHRGYNQSAKFAEGLSAALGLPWHASISLRKQATRTQTRKTRAQRWTNVADAFAVGDVAPIKDKHILLVDDIITTGATLEACGQQLLNHGCRSLSIACIAEA
jgi:ComF family protein